MIETLNMNEVTTDIVPYLLLLLITMTVSGMICMFSILYYLRNRRSASFVNSKSVGAGPCNSSFPVLPGYIFDRPSCWLAIRSRNIGAVQDALGLENATACSWMEGLTEASADNRLFVSPPIRGWILVFGPYLPRPSDDIDQCFRFLSRLSQELGEVQYFCGDAVTYEHSWARLVDGTVVRAYAWNRETLWNQGTLSDAEKKSGVETYGYAESPDPIQLGAQDRFRMNTERLFGLAGRWSVDPSRVNQSDLMSSGMGVSGNLSRPQPF